ncbi:MAG TPA: phosphoglycerate dehydrogenase [Anaeromyxobacteraceae bacterium]|nr:phosphoglycerate dehydrogenase [Anaeromyxobacteraceae bacterium]
MAHRVLVADELSPEGIEILRRAGLEVDVRAGMKPEELEGVVGDYDAIAVRSASKITARVLEKASRLKVVGRAGVGVDNVDLDAATRRGVVVMNTPGGSAVTVAELTLAMMLALSRHIAQATASVKAGKWEKKRFQGHELAGKTLGVVGIGNIGSVVVDRARAMKMRVIAYDPFVSPESAGELGVELVSLDDIWRQADVVSLHVPLTDKTRNLVNAGTLAHMKRGALLVNCARGGLVDEQALAAALASGQIGGAALDVFEKEPVSADHPLLKLDGFICTPHLGASTEEAQAAVAVAIAEQLAAYLTQGEVRNAVNVPAMSQEALRRFGPYLTLAGKLGSLAAQVAPGGAREVKVEFAGELAESPQRPITAQVLKGLLSHFEDAPVNEVSAPAMARERGIAVREERTPGSKDYVSLLTVSVRGQGGEAVVAGTVFGKQDPRIVRVNQFRLEAVPQGQIILCENDDAPGVVGNIGSTLGAAGVNIALISLSRDESRTAAVSLLNVDSAPGPDVLEKLRKLPHVRQVRHIAL